ncbi:MAG: FkbM family methyltransferase [Candidatus Omnitrophica bacterium]|nr:FkbM family methyltransferase [Candidatus Omnitrophota bacterium]
MKPVVERFPTIATIYRNVRDQLDFLRKPVETPWGFKFTGNSAMAQGIFEPKETALIRKILGEVDVLVNVGANVGYYCCHALSMGKQVIAFEPIQRNLRYLCQNIRINGWSGVEIYPIALSNDVGLVEIYGGDTGGSVVKGWAGVSENYATVVPTSTMDVVLGERLKGKKVLVLVDVEGAEKMVLEGAAKMLTNEPKPIWLVEITTTEHQMSGAKINPNFKKTFQFFFQNGYEAFTVDQNIKIITAEQVDLASRGIFRLATHNFLFSESKKT